MKTEKENIVYPPEFFIEGMRVKIKGLKGEFIVLNRLPKAERFAQNENETSNCFNCVDKNGTVDFFSHKELQPIIPKLSFTPDMLKALLSGNKTQTTRKAVTKTGKPAKRFKDGDVIRVGQRWGRDPESDNIIYQSDFPEISGPWQMGATLPTCAVRHLLRITSVKLKRPCEFSYFECLNEGIFEDGNWFRYKNAADGGNGWPRPIQAWEGLLKSMPPLKKPSDFEAFWNNEQIVYTFELIR